MNEITVPIYLMTGFLESGKTSFLSFTIQQDYFHTDGKTLLILCEEGEEEYDPAILKANNTVVEVIENEEDFTTDRLVAMDILHQPERVIIEYNGMWLVSNFEKMQLPKGWGVEQQITCVDGSTFQMQPNGHIVLNGDDDKLATVDGYHGVKPVFFGLDAKRDVYADQIVSRGLKVVSCRIHMDEDAFDVLVPTPGIHMVYNALAAAAVGRIYGLTIEEIKRGIESLETIRGRFKMIETENFLVVDDCYNANPMSMKASLDVLHDGEGRRVAILGDMGELGENEISLHKEVGEHAAKCGIDVCICVGELSVHMADAARTADPNFEVHYEKDRESLLKNLEGYVRKGDTILVKASHFMKFEEVVDALEKM